MGDWLRKNNPDLSNLDQPTAEAVTNLSGVPLPSLVTSQDAVSGPMEEAVDWLRKNDPDLKNVDEATMEAFTRLTDLPLLEEQDISTPSMTPAVKKKIVHDAVNWIRTHSPDLSK